MRALKKSHKWEDVSAVYARCPHCGWWNTYEGIDGEGDTIGHCRGCGKAFELGQQK